MSIYHLDGTKSCLGRKSKERLADVHKDLVLIATEVSKWMNVTIVSGRRDEEEQNSLVEQGFSQLKFPNSKHNASPSNAVDIAPYNIITKGIDWNDIEAFRDMVLLVKVIASINKIDINCGADWKSFKDYPHIELV